MTIDHVLEQELEKKLSFGLLHTLDASDKFAIDKDAFLSCDGMDTNQGMDGCDWVFAHQTAGCTRVCNHFLRGMNALQFIQHRTESR